MVQKSTYVVHLAQNFKAQTQTIISIFQPPVIHF